MVPDLPRIRSFGQRAAKGWEWSQTNDRYPEVVSISTTECSAKLESTLLFLGIKVEDALNVSIGPITGRCVASNYRTLTIVGSEPKAEVKHR
jgi:hypothetical protein